MPGTPLKVWAHRFAASVGSVFGDRNTGSDGPPDAIASLVDALRPLDRRSADLLHAASHQLRTPLTSIVGFAELLAEGAAGPLTAPQRRLLDLVAENAARMLEMVDDLAPALPDQHEPSGRPDTYGDQGAFRLPVPGPAPQEQTPRGKPW